MSRLSEEEITTSVDAWGGAAGKSGTGAGADEEKMGASTGDIVRKEATLRYVYSFLLPYSNDINSMLILCLGSRDVVQLQASLRGKSFFQTSSYVPSFPLQFHSARVPLYFAYPYHCSSFTLAQIC